MTSAAAADDVPDSDPTAPSPDDVVGRMGRAWRDLRRGPSTAIVRDRMFGTGDDAVEPGHMDVLDVLDRQPRWRMSDLANALNVDPSTITRTVQRMEGEDLVRRIGGADDRRVVTVEATEEGRRRHAAVASRRADIIEHVMAPMTPQQRRQLVDLLDTFVTALDDYVRGPSR